MKLLRNFLLTLMMVYSLANSQATAAEHENDGEQRSSVTRQNLTDGQNEGSMWKKGAIKFYAQNFGVINFVTIAAPIAAYGMYNLFNYIDESRQQQQALYNKQRELYTNNCELIAKGCNGTSFSTESCQAQLAQSPCFNLLFDCVSRLCGWDLLFVPNPDNKSTQILVNTHRIS